MLAYLNVQNVSVIEKLTLELADGLTVITGETGSGKSVLLGAMKLILGDRFQRTMLREGADKLLVEAVFTGLKSLPEQFKESFEIEDELVISRQTDEAGKNRIFINSRLSTVAQLKELAPYLADIHGQHEHQSLLDESRHIQFVDHLVPSAVKQRYAESYKNYRAAKSELEKLKNDIDDVKAHQDIVKFQLNEILSANIDLKKDEDIDEKVAFLANIEKIRESCALSLDMLSNGEVNASDLISGALRQLEHIADVIPDAKDMVAGLSDILDGLNETSKHLEGLYSRQDASPEELDALMHRKFLIKGLIDKYSSKSEIGDSLLAKVVSYGEQLSQKVNSFENSDEQLQRLAKLVAITEKAAKEDADILLAAREEAAKSIASQVVAVLGELELKGSRFEPRFYRKDSLDSSGGVDCKFYLSVNPGFEPAPLAQIASGGEISRVMLALKEVFSNSDLVDTLVFDEIDSGISGVAAKKVAEKLRKLGEKKQILVVTHLPVVAAAGSAHYYIYKDKSAEMTRTELVKLDNEKRMEIIASMISGEVTAPSLQQAKELLAQR